MIFTWLEHKIYEERLKKMGRMNRRLKVTDVRLVLVTISSPFLGWTSGSPENPLEYLKKSLQALLPTFILYLLLLVSSSLSLPFLHAWFISPTKAFS